MITRLSPEIVAAIAAGEVIERPASALKELVENSLDAGATRIVVELAGGGLDLIAVTDNGCGIPSSEIELAFQRHTTSKISSLKDLKSLRSFGFRGEALASIASSASRVVVTSLHADEPTGSRLTIENGKVVEHTAVGCPQGTRIEVYGLFRPVPARLKFLKDRRREQAVAQRTLIDVALGSPQVSYKLLVDGETAFTTQGEGLLPTYVAIFGEETELFPIQDDSISGLLSLNADWPSRSRQFFYVNHRPVSCQNLRHAVEAAYRSLEQKGRYPRFVIDLAVDPATVDVNVHPAKAEVRFVDEESVRKAVFSCIRENLTRRQYSGVALLCEHGANDYGSLTQMQQVLLTEMQPCLENDKQDQFRLLGTAYGRYLLAESRSAIYIIDQHAAHERVLYETLLKGSQGGTQPLLKPLCVSLPRGSSLDVAPVLTILRDLGFEAEAFGSREILIRSVPALSWGTESVNWGDILREVLAEGKPLELKAMAAAVAACHASIRTGDILSQEGAQALITRLFQCAEPYRCPHGRPTMITVSREMLEKRFGRDA
ncbi:MAG TPA: DNA mismatch repair endonuclease MutL [Firmicutes bacterium]|nr:DNA mismatch repair endonuclease MutL [Bacillota bacterium]